MIVDRYKIPSSMSSRFLLAGAAVAALAASAVPVQPRQVSLLVTNGIVITEDASRRVIQRGAVAVDGRDIVAVDDAATIGTRFQARETIDAAGAVVMPGLINTHTHAPMVLFRGLADDLALMDWLQKYIFPAEAKTVSPEFVRAGTRLAALEMIESGTTTYADMYYFEEEIGRATRAAGLRGVLGETIIQFPVPDAKTPAESLARTERFAREFAGDELITPAVAPHAMYTLDPDTLKACRALAARLNIPVIIHLAETKDELKTSDEKYHATPVAFLESINFWGPRTLAAHGVHVSPADIGILAKRPATTTWTCSRRCARRRSWPSWSRQTPGRFPRRWRSRWPLSAAPARSAWRRASVRSSRGSAPTC